MEDKMINKKLDSMYRNMIRNAKRCGLKVYWGDYESFKAWCFKKGYKEGYNFCRKNGRGDFTPSNCKIQIERSSSQCKHFILIELESGFTQVIYNLSKWCRETGNNVDLLHKAQARQSKTTADGKYMILRAEK